MLDRFTVRFLTSRGWTSLAAWARAADVPVECLHQARFHSRIADRPAEALARVAGVDVAAVRKILCEGRGVTELHTTDLGPSLATRSRTTAA